MTIKELKKLLSKFDDNMVVTLLSDAEGNSQHGLSFVTLEDVTISYANKTLSMDEHIVLVPDDDYWECEYEYDPNDDFGVNPKFDD